MDVHRCSSFGIWEAIETKATSNKKLLVTKGIATSNKNLLVSPGIATSNKDATSSSGPYYWASSIETIFLQAFRPWTELTQ